MLSAHAPASACARCRLRGMILRQEGMRKKAFAAAMMSPRVIAAKTPARTITTKTKTKTKTKTTAWQKSNAEEQERREMESRGEITRARVEGRETKMKGDAELLAKELKSKAAKNKTTTTRRSRKRTIPGDPARFKKQTPAPRRPKPERPGAMSHRDSVRLLEQLYTEGGISRVEWRAAVDYQAALQVKGDEGYEERVEERVRALREFYSGAVVPGVLLEEEERGVYERLFGKVREIEVVGEEEVEVEEVDDEGTGVLRDDGSEVEFLEEEVEEGKDVADDVREMYAEEEDDGRVREDSSAENEEEEGPYQRTHPLTAAGRFTTSPSTLEMPSSAFVEPVTAMLANLSTTHISEKAHNIFGGPGLPYSTSTPARGKTMHQKPIALDAARGQMSEIEADVYMSAIMPGIYSSVMSVLVETRKRMGTAWAENLVRKAEAGDLRILDAGGAGAGVLAVREMIRAEWERMHSDGYGNDSPLALAEVDGKSGGEGVAAPQGKATVLAGPDTLRKRVSKLFDNTTFVPRLPDYVHTEEQKHKGKFDLVIAPHTLWPLREDYLRKSHLQNLWSLLSTDGGVLLLLEKGVARGFEIVAGARDLLLDNHISSPDSETRQRRIDEPSTGAEKGEALDSSLVTKEPGTIIAPCTNHSSCPMYAQKGQIKGRRDICSFQQRYHRPSFLQRIFGTKGRNHEDVEFSYISVMRGKSQRPEQGQVATDSAFEGYEKEVEGPDGRSLPRAVMPPLKRQGHVILDLCTPAGTLERWTVPRSFSKTAYRDARKSSWGDLWALGAKTRVPRNVIIKKRSRNDGREIEIGGLNVQTGRSGRAKYGVQGGKAVRAGVEGLGLDEEGRLTFDEEPGEGRVEVKGRTRGVKVKGIRDKRDKKGNSGKQRKSRMPLD